MPREATLEETKFMQSLRRLLAKQPDTCMIYFAANGVNLHDISEEGLRNIEPAQSIESAPYVGKVDCGDY